MSQESNIEAARNRLAIFADFQQYPGGYVGLERDIRLAMPELLTEIPREEMFWRKPPEPVLRNRAPWKDRLARFACILALFGFVLLIGREALAWVEALING